jgi:hypothetical protein
MRLRRWERELVNELIDWSYPNGDPNEFLNQASHALWKGTSGNNAPISFTTAHLHEIDDNKNAIKKLSAEIEELKKRIKHLESP